jgi:hypothetical protein
MNFLCVIGYIYPTGWPFLQHSHNILFMDKLDAVHKSLILFHALRWRIDHLDSRFAFHLFHHEHNEEESHRDANQQLNEIPKWRISSSASPLCAGTRGELEERQELLHAADRVYREAQGSLLRRRLSAQAQENAQRKRSRCGNRRSNQESSQSNYSFSNISTVVCHRIS